MRKAAKFIVAFNLVCIISYIHPVETGSMNSLMWVGLVTNSISFLLWYPWILENLWTSKR